MKWLIDNLKVVSVLVAMAVVSVLFVSCSKEEATSPTEMTNPDASIGDAGDLMNAWEYTWEWTKPLGGVDLWGYCNYKGYQQAVLVPPKDAGSWRCYSKVKGQETWAGISVNAACQRQYPYPYYKDVSSYTDKWRDPFSWKCKGYKRKQVWK